MSTIIQLGALQDDIANLVGEIAKSDVGQRYIGQATDFATQKILENFKQVSFLSAYSKPYNYTGKQLTDFLTGKVKSLIPAAPPVPPKRPGIQLPELPKQKSLIERVKPTIVIEGSFGRKVIAPYGEANATEWKDNIRNLILIGAAGVILWSGAFYYLGYKKGQRSRG